MKVLLAIAFLGACAGTPLKETPNVTSQATAIEALLRTQQEAWNRGDIEAFMEGYWKDEGLIFTSGGEIRRGWQTTLERYQRRYGTDSSTMGTLGFEILDIKFLGNDGAIVLGEWTLDGLSEPAGGVFSVAMERGEHGWKIVHDHTSSHPGEE